MRKTFVSILVGLALIAPTETLIAAPKSPKLAKCDGVDVFPEKAPKSADTAKPDGQVPPISDASPVTPNRSC